MLTESSSIAKLPFDVKAIREQFPILKRQVHQQVPLIYFDNAATTQKPYAVLQTLSDFYQHHNANIHRGLYALADEADSLYEKSRRQVQNLLNAKSHEEIIFTHGTTESINLVAQTFGRKFLNPGDEIIISQMEHHANIVPWQLLAREKNLVLKIIPFNEQGILDLVAYQQLLSAKTRLVAVCHVSNVLGVINPAAEIIRLAHQVNAYVLIDGAQAITHLNIDVQQLDADFYAFSSHKIFGPTGVGVLYGKKALLAELPPWQGGGGMIEQVCLDGNTTFAPPPHRFEAGTPAIAEVVGFGAALTWFGQYDFNAIGQWQKLLLQHLEQVLTTIPQLRILGTAPQKATIVSFTIERLHPQDIALLIDQFGVSLRSGHHCAQPLLACFGLAASCRVSLTLYNTLTEIDQFATALQKVIAILMK